MWTTPKSRFPKSQAELLTCVRFPFCSAYALNPSLALFQFEKIRLRMTSFGVVLVSVFDSGIVSFYIVV